MHPIVLEIPFIHLPIYSYGMMLGLAFICGWHIGFHFSNREGLSYQTVNWAYMIAILFALLGARVAHIITNPDNIRMYGLAKVIFTSRCEGLVAYGGYIGGVLAVWVYSRLKKFDFWSLVDCTTPSMILGLGLTRIGCFLAGCCHGQPTDLPWAISFPPGSQASGIFPQGGSAGAGIPSVPVHPTQLYESLVGFVLFPLAWILVQRRRFTGQAFLVLVCCYATLRFLLEFIRGDDDRGAVLSIFSTSQFIGLVLFPLCIGLYFYRSKKAPAPPTPLSKAEIEERLIAEGVLKKKK